MPLHGALGRFVRSQPDAEALRMGDHAVSYGELWAGISARYHALAALPRRARIASPDQPLIALMLGNHPLAPAWLALALSTPVTLALLDPAWPRALQREMLDFLAPDVLVCTGEEAFGLPQLPPEWPGASAEVPPPAASQDAALFIGFTSGTTARPKAFLRNRASWRLSLRDGRSAFDLGAASHTLAPGPLIHGLTFYALAETLDVGAAFEGMARFVAQDAAEILASGRINRLVAVPTMIEGLMREGEARQITLPLRQIVTAGAKLPPRMLNRMPHVFPKASVSEYYGASELGFVSLEHHRLTPEGTLESGSGGVGRAFPGVEIEIRRAGMALASGQTGAVHVRGPHAIEGYLLAEAAHSFTREGDLASVGDLGWLDEAGNLHLMGRTGGMVITGGHNVYPAEIAQILGSAPGIDAAEVFGLEDTYLGARLEAVIEGTAALSDIAAFCARHMPRYKIPRAFYRVARWPMTPSGKIARTQVQKWIETRDPRLAPVL